MFSVLYFSNNISIDDFATPLISNIDSISKSLSLNLLFSCMANLCASYLMFWRINSGSELEFKTIEDFFLGVKSSSSFLAIPITSISKLKWSITPFAFDNCPLPPSIKIKSGYLLKLWSFSSLSSSFWDEKDLFSGRSRLFLAGDFIISNYFLGVHN